MTQEEKWQQRYKEVVDFIEANHRNPSKHRLEEHDMLNWVKAKVTEGQVPRHLEGYTSNT